MDTTSKHRVSSAEQLLEFIRDNLISAADDGGGRAVQIDFFTRQGGVANVSVTEKRSVKFSKK